MANTVITNDVSPVQNILEQAVLFIRDIWRFRKPAIILSWVIALAGWTVVFLLPDKYEASARILVDTDSVLRPLLKGLAVESDLDSRLALMTKTLLSRPNMEKVLLASDIDIKAGNRREKEKLIDKLRENIDIASTRQHNLYKISYENKNPDLAKSVVQSLLNIFIENTLGGSRQDSDIARKFLSQQIEEYEKKLIAAEQRLMKFKRENMGLLPGQDLDYFGRLQKNQAELEQAEFELRQARHKRDEINRQIKELIESAAKPGLNNMVTSVDSRIQTLKEKLDDLLLRYTDEHPDVKEIQLTLSQLEEKRDEEIKAISDGGTSKGLLETSPVYQELKLTLGKASSDIAAAEVRVKEFRRRINDLEQRVNTLPKIEAELVNLNRDYNINKQQYDELLSRRESAKMSEEAESAGDKVKFQIIEPPYVPPTPSSPKRHVLNILVLFAAFGIGAGFVFGISQLSPVVYDPKTLNKVSGHPVLGSISFAVNEESVKAKRKEMLKYSLFLITLPGMFVLVTMVYTILDKFQ